VFDHVTIRVSDHTASERFYDTVLGVLGLERQSNEPWSEWGDFSISDVTADHPLTKRLHIGFRADSRDTVDEFWRIGTGAGYRDDGPPGPRRQYAPDYYGAFLLDHLWIGVADLDESQRFYETIGPWTGFEPRRHDFGVGFAGPGGSFSLTPREPTENVHVAFPARGNETVEAFHRAALAAGYRDNGAPGERATYHPGYYGAFVLDPDGNNVEVVNHNR
jgi:catechol 2,3-dioxygenase-like lactoylglutathione lyase family enzyme